MPLECETDNGCRVAIDLLHPDDFRIIKARNLLSNLRGLIPADMVVQSLGLTLTDAELIAGIESAIAEHSRLEDERAAKKWKS